MKSERPTSALPGHLEQAVPAVPLTLEGSVILHQMFRLRWSDWKSVSAGARVEIVNEAVRAFDTLERDDAPPATQSGEQSGLFSLLGHKGDLMIVHFRRTFDAANAAELQVARLKLNDFLEPTSSYVSVIELGLYNDSVQLYRKLTELGRQPGSDDWQRAVEDALDQKRTAMATRLWPSIPPHRYLSFYPMDKKRAEHDNWYRLPITDRQRLMREHGMIGRRYAGQITQIISGSIGFDDWEWGVDLFADDPLVFKKLVYEMRFDEASAAYGVFGSFYLGLRFRAAGLAALLDGNVPRFGGD